MDFDEPHVLKLLRAIKEQYVLDWKGIHGASHWARVWVNGMRLAEETGAIREVVGFFALFHDARRFNDRTDPEHGKRGADLAARWRGEFFDLNNEDFDLLYTACAYHADGLTEAEVTVQTCWDADRLDLGRVGIQPTSRYLCTEAARGIDILKWADSRACLHYFPENVFLS
jgi:uncharacterized protein